MDHLILHHYDLSPYAEKIRILLGRADASWHSVLSPVVPPRPNVEPLAGGYRRIPVAQLGADVFCDTAVIAAEVATMTGHADLGPASTPEEVRPLVARAESNVFFAAATNAPPLKLITALLRNFGPAGAVAFVRDRNNLARSASSQPPRGPAAARVFGEFMADLDKTLAGRPFLSGDIPGYADAAAYHPIWMNLGVRQATVSSQYPNAKRWYDRVMRVGHGYRKDIQPDMAFAAARDNEPRPLPSDRIEDADSLGRRVGIKPADYLPQATVGELVAVTPDRFILARDSHDLGRVHVHFPREDYTLSPA